MATSVPAADVKRLREATGAGILDAKKALEENGGDFDAATDWLRKKGAAGVANRAGRAASEGAIAAALTGTSDGGRHGTAAALVEINCETDFVARNDEFQRLVANAAHVALDTNPRTAEALLAAGSDRITAASLGEELTRVAAILKENVTLRRFERYSAGDGGLVGTYIHQTGNVGVMVELGGPADALPQLALDVCLQIAAMRPAYVASEDIPEDIVARERAVHEGSDEVASKPERARPSIVEGKLRKWFGQVALLDQEWVKEKGTTIAALLARHDATVARFVRYERGEDVAS